MTVYDLSYNDGIAAGRKQMAKALIDLGAEASERLVALTTAEGQSARLREQIKELEAENKRLRCIMEDNPQYPPGHPLDGVPYSGKTT